MYLLYNVVHRGDGANIEGIGALYQRVVSLIGICKKFGLKYIHQKIPIGHKYANITDDEWDNTWDRMFNLESLFETNANDNNIDTTKYDRLTYDILFNEISKNKKSYYITNPYDVSYNEDVYVLIQSDIIEAYNESNKNRLLMYDKNKTSIAIHIRVWNDCDDSFEYNNYVNNNTVRFNYTADKYIDLIKRLQNKYPNYDIHIFSQLKYFDINYSKLRELHYVHFHLEMDPIETFHHLCKADVLVLGLSSFSHLAGMYNNNTVVYLPYCHPPALKTWILDHEV